MGRADEEGLAGACVSDGGGGISADEADADDVDEVTGKVAGAATGPANSDSDDGRDSEATWFVVDDGDDDPIAGDAEPGVLTERRGTRGGKSADAPMLPEYADCTIGLP